MRSILKQLFSPKYPVQGLPPGCSGDAELTSRLKGYKNNRQTPKREKEEVIGDHTPISGVTQAPGRN